MNRRQILLVIFGVLLCGFVLMAWRDSAKRTETERLQALADSVPPMPELEGDLEALRADGFPIRMREHLASFTNADPESVEAFVKAAMEISGNANFGGEDNPLHSTRVRRFEESVLPPMYQVLVQAWIQTNAPKVKKFQDALKGVNGWIPLPENLGLKTKLLKHSYVMEAGMVLGLAGLYASQAKEVDEAIARVMGCLELGDYLTNDRINVGPLAGCDQKLIATRIMERLLAENRVPAEKLVLLKERFSGPSRTGVLQEPLRMELCMGIETLMWRKDEFLRLIMPYVQTGPWYPDEMNKLKIWINNMKGDGRYARDLWVYVETIKALLEADGAEFPTRLRLAAEVLDETMATAGGGGEPKKKALYSRMMLPGLGKLFEGHALAELGVRAARLGIAARLHEEVRGKVAEKAEDLVPEFIQSVPEDPWTGQPLELRTENQVWGVFRPKGEEESGNAPGPDVVLFRLAAGRNQPAGE